MPGWLVVVLLLASNVALHAAVRAVVPDAARPWTTANLLTWVAWFTVVAPALLVGWSRLNQRQAAQVLRKKLDAWKAGTLALGPLASALVEAQAHPLLEELLVALEPRRGESKALDAFLDAGRRFVVASGYGSGAFHADGWAALNVVDAMEAAKAAADALP